MKSSWIVIALAALVVAAGPALARGKQRPAPRCVDGPFAFSWTDFLLGTGPEPQPNGCAPPVFSGNRYIGQDPDANVRLQLQRDPGTGNVDFLPN